MATMKVYAAPAVNAHILEKQFLGSTKASSAEDALRALLAIDSGSLPNTCYSLSLRARNFNVTAFQQSLQSGKLARVRGLKGNLQVVPVELMPAIFTASSQSREARSESLLEGWGIQEAEYLQVRTAIIDALGSKEKTLSQLKTGLKPGVSRDLIRSRGKAKERSTNIAVVATAMWERWELLRGGIGRVPGEDPGRYSLFSRRFGMKLAMDRREALKKLTGQFIAAYGPVCADDLAWWLGIPAKEAATLIDAKTTERIAIEGITGDFFMAAGEMIKDNKPSANVVMLPVDDPYVKAYTRRERIVPELYLDKVIMRFGESNSTVLVNGTVSGTWHLDHETDGEAVHVEMFGPAAKSAEASIESAAHATGRFFTGADVSVSMSVNKKGSSPDLG